MTLEITFGSLLLVAAWEFCRPRRQREFPALRRRLGNLGIWLVNILLAAFILAPMGTLRPPLEARLGYNLPSWPITAPWLSFVAAFLLLDFLHYAVHRCEHAVRLLWRSDALHHSDPDPDVTTSVRHHPIEYLLVAAFYWLAVLALDVPLWVVLSHALALLALAAIQHGNIRLPQWVERILQPVVITLDLHLVHHSIAYANANFGAVFSIWDRVFGTYARLPRSQLDRIVCGVGELPRRDACKPSAMLLTPWRLGRDDVA